MINSNKNQTKAIRGRERTCDRGIKNKKITPKHINPFGFTSVQLDLPWSIQSISFNFGPIWSNSILLVHSIQFGPLPLFWSILFHFGQFQSTPALLERELWRCFIVMELGLEFSLGVQRWLLFNWTGVLLDGL